MGVYLQLYHRVIKYLKLEATHTDHQVPHASLR